MLNGRREVGAEVGDKGGGVGRHNRRLNLLHTNRITDDGGQSALLCVNSTNAVVDGEEGGRVRWERDRLIPHHSEGRCLAQGTRSPSEVCRGGETSRGREAESAL
jgi:hypothetical protein